MSFLGKPNKVLLLKNIGYKNIVKGNSTNKILTTLQTCTCIKTLLRYLLKS